MPDVCKGCHWALVKGGRWACDTADDHVSALAGTGTQLMLDIVTVELQRQPQSVPGRQVHRLRLQMALSPDYDVGRVAGSCELRLCSQAGEASWSYYFRVL